MAFSAYCGSTGEGKTYEVVENVIVKALGQGRRVLTNVTGLKLELIHAYLRKQGIEDDQFGELVNLPSIEKCAGRFAIINETDTPELGEPEAKLDEENSLIQGGDVVVLDEVWRIWKRGTKIHPNDEKFWRMHRHILHKETNVSTDIVLITQNWADLNTTLRGLVHQRFVMKKHTSLGFSNKYSVNVYDIGARTPHITMQRTYRQEVFDLYKSHSLGSGAGKENKIDDRGNLLKRLIYTTLIPAVFALTVGGYFVYKFFSPSAKQQRSSTPEHLKDEPTVQTEQASPVQVQSAEDAQNEALSKLSPYRVTGYASSPNGIILFIDVQGTGLRQVIAPDNIVISGQYVEFELDGKLVGTMTGKLQTKTDKFSPN